VIFETITGKSTVGNTYTGAVTGRIGAVSRVSLLQQQATEVTDAVPGVPGDYNNDGVVDSADYTVWRDQLGSLASLPNDNTPGVAQDDYDRWTTQFGTASDSLTLAASSVAEPSSTSLLIIGTVFLGCRQFVYETAA
jgi:hypothetical protein